MKTTKKRILTLIIFLLLIFQFLNVYVLEAQDSPEMYAHFINVGQGDATLLEFPYGAILIDTGAQDNEYVAELIDYLNDFFNIRTDKDVLEFMKISIEGYRSGMIEVKAATGPKTFKDYKVYRKIYATAWDKTIKVKATLDGLYRVTGNN